VAEIATIASRAEPMASLRGIQSHTRQAGADEATHPYVYVLIRMDIPLHQQLVQSAHAAFEAGLRWHSPDKEGTSIIILEVPDKKALLRASRRLGGKDIAHHVFFEPDFEMGESALATRPLVGEERRALSGYPLWGRGGRKATQAANDCMEAA